MNQPQQLAYYIYDHLGNTRVNFTPIIDNSSGTCDLVASLNYAADFYPYGKILREYQSTPNERYLTTQHERDEETGLDYRGARFYDSDIARFLSLDPHASNYPSLCDYSYVRGMPTIAIDADGKDIIVVVEVNEIVDGKEQTVTKALNIVKDRKLIDKYIPNFGKAYDIAKQTSLKGVDEHLSTGEDLLVHYENSETDDIYLRWESGEYLKGTGAHVKSDVDPSDWEKELGIDNINKDKKFHLVGFNSFIMSEESLEEIFLEDGDGSSIILHEILFHIYWINYEYCDGSQHDKVYGTTADKHKDHPDNAVKGSPQKNLEINAEKAAKEYFKK